MSLNYKRLEQLLGDYIKMEIALWRKTDLPTEQEAEKIVTNLEKAIFDLSSSEMVELTHLVLKLAEQYTNHYTQEERMFIIILLLENTLGLRESKKFIEKYNLMKRSDPRTMIEYSPTEEKEFTNLLLKLKESALKGNYYKINGLIENVTGHIDSLYD